MDETERQIQIEDIREVLEITGLQPEELAERVLIKPESMRKIMKGYQPASHRLMELIKSVGREAVMTDAKNLFRSAHVQERSAEEAEMAKRIERQVAFILRNGEKHELTFLQGMIGQAFDIIRDRRRRDASAQQSSKASGENTAVDARRRSASRKRGGREKHD